MKKLTLNVGKKYDILIEKNLLDNCGKLIREVSKAKKAGIITDSNVGLFYAERVKESLEKEGFEVFIHIFRAGEQSKNFESIYRMLCFLAENTFTRSDIVVALGGGVTGDMAGFTAASYMRGIDFVQIPTSLLAQIDSSVGGKTGVDLPQGKNLCGAFWQPRRVIIDPEVLSTLPKAFFTDGMAEAIKAGCIKDKALFERLEKENAPDFIEDMIYSCVDMKRKVVENDEREKGERMLLNFGHTLGHAIEKYYDFKGLSHGQAVAVGMVLVTRASEKAGITEKGTTERLIELIKKYGLPFEDKAELAELLKITRSDKKMSNSGLNFVMLKEIGESFTKPLTVEQTEEFFS
ncbi:MAG: 3-dehydroquinate synthase [Clostridiales bacterium]|nr:3-dehydroquinate synthase [Clostridiales bacterium]